MNTTFLLFRKTSIKTLGILLLVTLSEVSGVLAQGGLKAVGTGTSSAADILGPTTSSSSGARVERQTAIYTSTELTDAAISANATFYGIGWNKTGVGFHSSNFTIRVWLKHIGTATFSANPSFATETSSATKVFETTTATIPAAAGVYKLIFNQGTLFQWNGTDNIQVITEISRSASWNDNDFNWAMLAASTNSAATSNSAAGTDALARSGSRPQLYLDVAALNGDDAALTAMPAPNNGLSGFQNIDVYLKNTGTTLLASANINWSVDGGASTLFPWSGGINPGDSLLVTLSNENFALGNHTISATITDANGAADVNSNNNISKSILVCQALAGNAYTINKGQSTGGTNFNNFNDLATVLTSCGITDDVTVNVVAGTGPYTEQVVFQNIPGLGAANTLTINGNGNTITSAQPILSNVPVDPNPNRHIIKLKSLSYVTLSNLNIVMNPPAGPTFNAFVGVHILNSGSNITINNVNINMGSNTSSLAGGIVASNSETSFLTGGVYSNLVISNNTTTGGGFGVVVYGSSNATTTGNVISSNTITNVASNGVYINTTGNTIISGNIIHLVNGGNCIQVAGTGNANALVEKNRLSAENLTNTSQTFKGIVVGNSSGHKILNNIISNFNVPRTDISGIEVGTGGTEVAYNTIVFDGDHPVGGHTWGFQESTNNTGAKVRNNVFVITRFSKGYSAAIAVGTTTTLNNTTNFLSNGNAFLVTTNVAVKAPSTIISSSVVTQYPTLASWQTATSNTHDLNSVTADPLFETGTYKPTNLVLNNIGADLSSLTTLDIASTARSSTPDPGAYEFNVATDDAGLIGFVKQLSVCAGGSVPVQFTLLNNGSNVLNTAAINWSINGVVQAPVNLTALNLNPGATTNISLGTAIFAANTLYTIEAVVSGPNGSADPTVSNNTYTEAGFRAGMNGSYTINQNAIASGTNFVSFVSATNALATYGVCGPVVIDVAQGSGPYIEFVRFKNIPGATATNTITIQGHADTIKATGDSYYNPIVHFDGAKHITLDNIVIHSLDGTYGWGVLLRNNSEHINITNNTITLSADGSDFACGIVASNLPSSYNSQGNNSNNIVISGNTINRGYSGVAITGLSGSPVQNHTISNNVILNARSAPVVTSYTNATVIRGNRIRVYIPTSSGVTDFKAIDADVQNTDISIEKNRIYDLWEANTSTSQSATGIYIGANSSGTISNNLIYDFKNRGTQYGIRTNGNSVNIYHNTVALNGTFVASSATTSAVFLGLSGATGQSGININNNIFLISRAGTGVKSMVNAASVNTNPASNYNVFFFGTTAGTPVIGRKNTTNHASLAAWQGTTGNPDISSIEADPQFTDSATGNFLPVNMALQGYTLGTSQVGGINDDILNETRTSTPDPGAYEMLEAEPTVATHPGNTTVCENTNASFTTSSVSVPTPTVYWERTIDGSSWDIISAITDGGIYTGFNTGTLTVNNVSIGYHGYKYRAVFTNSGGTVTSNEATLSVSEATQVGVAGSDQAICSGTTPVDLELNSSVGTILKWQRSSDAIFTSPIDILASGSAILTGAAIGNPSATTYFRAIVKSGVCDQDTSNVVTINVSPVSVGGTASSDQAFCPNTTPADLSLMGHTGNVVKWQRSNNLSFITPMDIPSSANATLTGATIGSLSATTYFRAVVQSGVCDVAYSNTVTITVNASVGGSASSSQSVCIGNTAADITLSGNTGSIVKWQRSTINDFSAGVTDIANTTATLSGASIGALYQTTYFRAVVQNGSCTEANSTPVTLTVTSTVDNTTALAGTAGGASVCANYDIMYSNNYMNNCNVIATVTASGASPVSGSINACVKIDATVQTAPDGVPYVQRHFDILPASSPTTATSTIRLYFTESDFTSFNANNTGFLDLPVNNADAAKANLRITQYNGTGTAPGNYTGTAVLIDPADADIVHNATAGRWEVTFSATGSGGFYVHTTTSVLPVTGLELKGQLAGTINRLAWATVTETNNKGFELQRSSNGTGFSTIASISTKAVNGNSTSPLNYSYNDEKPLAGNNYYRLKQTDKDGKFTYSNTVLLIRKVKDITLTGVYPNPTERELNVVINSPKQERVTIIVTDLSGKVVMQQLVQVVTGDNQKMLNVQSLAAGTYIIKAVCADGCETAVHRFVKQ